MINLALYGIYYRSFYVLIKLPSLSLSFHFSWCGLWLESYLSLLLQLKPNIKEFIGPFSCILRAILSVFPPQGKSEDYEEDAHT